MADKQNKRQIQLLQVIAEVQFVFQMVSIWCI